MPVVQDRSSTFFLGTGQSEVKRVLFIGQLDPGSTTSQRLRAFQDLGHDVTAIHVTDFPTAARLARLWYRLRNRIGRPADRARANHRILAAVASSTYDVVWIDKSLMIRPETIHAVKRRQPQAQIIGYSPDDMAARHNQSIYFLKALPLFDAYFTTKSYNVAELSELGCPRVEFVGNAYDPHTHRPIQLSSLEKQRIGGPVGFVGTYEHDRAASMLTLAQAGISVRVYGNGWNHMLGKHRNLTISGPAQYGDEYARLLSAFDINLCFLRKINRDLQTQRSVEIPACRGFMLAERTAEHQALFEEGKEADYFSNDMELLSKTRHYLHHDDQRDVIRAAGYRKCLDAKYSYHDRIQSILATCHLNSR